MVAQAPALAKKYGIDDALVLANMMGEFTEECAGGTELVENLNYRASVLVSQWPSHFTQTQAVAMQHNPQLIANQAYNGRMGNRPGTNDGFNFRGRGFCQTTGRDGYVALGKIIGVDLVSNPDQINDVRWTFECAFADFVRICGCLPWAQRDDEVNETRHLNGGLIGLAQRQASIRLWKRALNVST
jgi:putative chitinase